VKIIDDSLTRQQNAALLLSTTGAALGGVGVGVLLSDFLDSLGIAILLIGLLAHGVGMLGSRRVQRAQGHDFSWLEVGAYWLCWVLIAIVLVYVAARVISGG
jgi:hypothetical protein